jgi:hypothetical protein
LIDTFNKEKFEQVKLLTLEGKEIDVTILINGNKLQISKLNLSKGVYIIVLKTKNHRFVQRLIKI